MAREKNINQIVRKDAKNCFVEVMSSAFEIEKVLLNFYNYNMNMPANSRLSAGISVYLGFDEFYRICWDATVNYRLDRALDNSITKMRETGAKYPEPITLYMGGKPANDLNAAGKARPDGMSLSRQMQIVAGTKYPIILQALSGPGKLSDKGLIVPQYNYANAEETVKIPLTREGFEELLLITKAHMDAYIAARYNYRLMNPGKTPPTGIFKYNGQNSQNGQPQNNQGNSGYNNSYNPGNTTNNSSPIASATKAYNPGNTYNSGNSYNPGNTYNPASASSVATTQNPNQQSATFGSPIKQQGSEGQGSNNMNNGSPWPGGEDLSVAGNFYGA